MNRTSLSRIGAANKCLLAVMSGLAFMGNARAESVAPDVEAAASDDVIIVTAQRRKESIQDVPISIVSFSAETLKEVNITNTADLVHITPGLLIPVDANFVKPRLRGVGTIASGPSIENPVAIYIDGVYISASAGSTFSLNNITNIEIDKGPQGTLFGRNATGGLIQIITRDPREAFGWSGSISYGNYNTVGGDLYVTGSVAPNLSADLAAYVSYQVDGYGTNAFNGDNTNYARDYALRSKWMLTASDDTTVKLTLDYRRTDASPQLIPARGSLPFGGPPYTGPIHGMNAFYTPESQVESGGASLRVDHDFGFASLMSLSAYSRTRMEIFYDSFTTDPQTTILLHNATQNDQASQEFQLQSPGSSLIKWTTGLYLYYANAKYRPVQLFASFFSPFSHFSNISNERTLSAALYGQATTEILTATNLTFGLRYTKESRKAKNNQFLQGNIPDFFLGGDSAKISAGRLTWRVSLDHRFSPDLMTYISYNRGFKSGGFNQTQLPLLSFKPETLDAIEAGVKASAFDNRLKVNAAGFYYIYKNIQTVKYPTGSAIVFNGTGADLYGIDIDITASITDRFKLIAGGEFMHSKYGDFPNAPLSVPLPGGGIIYDMANAKGRQVAVAPNNSISLIANYDVPTSYGQFKLTANYSHVSKWYAEADHRLSQPAYDVVNAQLSFAPNNDTWKVRLWAKNLFDEKYLIILGSQGTGDFAGYAAPRTYGITLEKPL